MLLNVFITYGRVFLPIFHQGIGYSVKKLLCTLIAKMLNTLSAKTIMYGKAYTNQWNSQSTRNVIAFTITYHNIRFKLFDRFR